MTRRTPAWQRWLLAFTVAVLAGCGGGGSGSPPIVTGTGGTTGTPAPSTPDSTGGAGSTPAAPANAVAVRVDGGTDGSAINSPFVTVTVCAPGTSTCQTIDHVLVDTGSFGLRLAASAVSALTLPAVTAPNGAPLAECAQFASGFAWGVVRAADVTIAGEKASAIPIQLVATDATASSPPTACANTGPNFGVGPASNGILGVGLQTRDCGVACTASTSPNMYFACTDTCSSTLAPLASQVVNPVAAFPVDNNGVVMVLPAVPVGGSGALGGQLIFGIGTQANNQLGSATVYRANAVGEFTTTYKGATYPAFIDSGSNAYFFHDPSLPTCSGGFYCPANPTPLSATITSATGTSTTIPFTVESVTQLGATVDAAHLAADIGSSGGFDWGLPFFFGRTVFLAISGANTTAGAGPYWAF